MTDYAEVPPHPAGQFSTIQFQIPSSVADALELETIRPRARAAGVPNATLEYSTKNVRGGGYRLTCGRAMAAFLIDAMIVIAGTAEGQLAIDCAGAVKNIMDAIKS